MTGVCPKMTDSGGKLEPQSQLSLLAPASKVTRVPLLEYGASYQGIAFLAPTRVRVGIKLQFGL